MAQTPARKTRSPKTRPKLNYLVGLAILLGGLHVYSLAAFGATFWIDSLAYASLGRALGSAGGLKIFYEGAGRWIYSQIQPGLPLIWVALSAFPDRWQWPIFAVFQHALAACALFSVTAVVHRIWPTPFHIVACAVLCLLPFYQSFHNAFLTESITSSLLLIALALSLKIVYDPVFKPFNFWLLLACMFAISQFRSYFGLTLALFAAWTLYRHKFLSSVYTVFVLGMLAFTITAYPLYRYSCTGQFFLPEGGMTYLISALWANPAPSSEMVREFQSTPFPAELPATKLLREGLNYDQALELAGFWQRQGMTNAQIERLSENLSHKLLMDRKTVTMNRIYYGIASSGFVLPYRLLPQDSQIFRGRTVAQLYAHEVENFRWLSWMLFRDYTESFISFFRSPALATPYREDAQKWMCLTWEPYLMSNSLAVRDPLGIGYFLPDIWFSLGIISGVFFLFYKRDIGILISGAFLLNFAAAAAFPLRNTRYAYPLLPFSFVAFMMVVGFLWNRWRPLREKVNISEQPISADLEQSTSRSSRIESGSGSKRAENEIRFGAALALVDTEKVWGWGTPAGKIRAESRGNRIIDGAKLRPGMRVLEIGCGTGMFTEMFASTGAHILAVDLSPELVEKARLRGLPEERIVFMVKRFEEIETSESFDAIVGSSVLHHMDIDQALANIVTLLKPGGWISFAEPNMLNPQVFLERKLRFLPVFSYVSPDETAFVGWDVKKLLLKRGFVDVSVEPLDWLHPSVPESLIRSVILLGRALEKTPLIRDLSGSLYLRARKPGSEDTKKASELQKG
jgi:2-polyprenyl-3-methyl-5-hydroxy-6-metoxy-1,4-benzoquinol methylase